MLAVDLLNLNADDRHFINTLLGEGEVSVRNSAGLTTVKVKYRRRSSADYGGCADVAAEKLLEDKLEAGFTRRC